MQSLDSLLRVQKLKPVKVAIKDALASFQVKTLLIVAIYAIFSVGMNN